MVGDINTVDRQGIPADNVNWDAGVEVYDKWTIDTFAIGDTAVMKEVVSIRL